MTESKGEENALQCQLRILNPELDILKSLEGLYESKRYEDAEKLALSLTRDFPNHPTGWKFLGAILAVTNRKVEAVRVNRKAVSLSPEDAAIHFNLGAMLEGVGDLEEAEASFRRTISLVPDLAEAHKRLGKILLRLGRHREGLRETRLGEGVITFDLRNGSRIT